MAPMGRPPKEPDSKSLRYSVTLEPEVDAMLSRIMAQDGSDNRSATLADLVREETARRQRRKATKGKKK